LAEVTLRSDLVGTEDEILFEHLSGRGDPEFPGDQAAF